MNSDEPPHLSGDARGATFVSESSAISETVLDAIISADASGKIIYANRGALKMFGFSSDELMGKTLNTIIPPRFQKPCLEGRTHVLATGHSKAGGSIVDASGCRKDGSEFPVEITHSTWSADGKKFFSAVIRDTSEKVAAIEKLRQTETYLRLLIENVTDYAIFMLDPSGKVMIWNAGAERIFGYAKDEVLGQHFSFFYDDEERSKGTPDQILSAAAEHGKHETTGWRLRKDGTSFLANFIMTSILDDDKKLVGFAEITRDITEKRLSDDELEKRTRDLQRSNRDLQQFAYAASHDLQEPLRMIASYVQALREDYGGKFDENGEKYLQIILDSSLRLRRMISDILEFSKVGSPHEEREAVDCNLLVTEVVDNLRDVCNSTCAKIICDKLPVVSGYKSQLTRLFQNLISNAIKFRNDVPPTVDISCVDHGSTWEFSFKDNGIGIDPKYCDKIFVIFQRLHWEAKYPGTGMGLSLCKRIVEKHDGRIWVKSEPGRGSTFFFTIKKHDGAQPWK